MGSYYNFAANAFWLLCGVICLGLAGVVAVGIIKGIKKGFGSKGGDQHGR